MKQLHLTFAVVAALVLALTVPAFASPGETGTSTPSISESHPEVEAANDIEDVNETEASEVENEGTDK
jgi:hypothetical protein